MNPYEMWLQPENFTVVAFYPYTSIVTCPLLEQSHNYKSSSHEFLKEFGEKIKQMVLEKGVIWDNKVVVEIKPYTKIEEAVNSNLFVGFKDGLIRIGLGVWMVDKTHSFYKVIRF